MNILKLPHDITRPLLDHRAAEEDIPGDSAKSSASGRVMQTTVPPALGLSEAERSNYGI